MGVASDNEPRTSMERHLMDRDREGQLYLEARRQQAAVDLLKNRTSFLSTITPPSSNPSSAASSLFREPTGSSASSSSSLPPSTQQQQQSQQQPPFNSTAPNTPTSPLTNMSPAVAATTIHAQSQSHTPSPTPQAHSRGTQGAVQGQGQAGASSLAISSSTPYPYTTPPSSSTHTSTRATTNNNNTTTMVLPPASPLQNIVSPNHKKTRQRSATTGPGRGRSERNDNFIGIPDRLVLPISPSSLEYQLTANLLNYPHPAAAANTSSTAQSRPRSRSRSKSRPQQPQPPLPSITTMTKARRHTVNKDARIDTTSFAPTSRGTGHRQQQNRDTHHKHNDSNGNNGSNGITTTTTTSSNSSSKKNNRHNNGNSAQPMTPQEWTPTSLLGSYPPSPTAACALGPSSTSDNPYFTAASTTITLTTPTEPKLVSVPLPPIPPSPPLPPLPPKSPQTLIAQYFPRSLAPPPSRDRAPYGQREPIVAPTPFKTPTFGPALISPTLASTTTHPDAPPLPPPSASFQYIPTADISRVSTSHALHSSQHHQHLFTEDNSSDFSSSSNRPSPNASVIGFQGSAAPTPPPRMMPHQQHPARLPSDLDLILHNSRQRSSRLACSNSTVSKQGASSVSSNEGSGPLSSLDEIVVPGPVVPTAPVLLFAPLRPRSPAAGAAGIRATPSTTSLANPPIPPSPTTLPTTPIYPRGLSSPSILGDNAQVIIRLHQKPVPYIRELVPGKETGLAASATTITTTTAAAEAGGGTSSTVAFVTTPPSQPASTNTSRDLEMILDEITGRLRTNRTSMDPWAYHLSPWDDKPLPPVRRERGSRYWVFRDQDGLIPGPILFLAGHLFPPLWWVGALYPRLEHPDDVAALEAEIARAAEMEAYSVAARAASAGTAQAVEGQEDDVRDRQNWVALQWLQRQLKTLGVTVASITLSSSSSSKPQPGSNNTDDGDSTIATLQISQVLPSSGDDNEREGSTLANISTIHVPYQPPAPMPPSILDSRGPWAARGGSSRASSLFEQRMAHDRKVLRYELDLRWRRINLLWSFASLLLAICLVAIVLGVRK
ncbi:hypothetical protein K457DRAFT_20478 [Linnemannia elongata AG-77]|uniref:Uncharacterized protein n=1 Tax=Linnemannia elongata AG-77 TaxID=1314771 RepID=A0A197JUF6_9FUNG|nr:hypothetical protein K457DRAFT_20478 [Linnemannia elongata AG-77]